MHGRAMAAPLADGYRAGRSGAFAPLEGPAMLFVTNRALKEGIRTEKGRAVDFDLANNNAGQSVFYCERARGGSYVEIGSAPFMDRIKESKCRQVLFYLHGYSNLPEPDVFPRAEDLQSMCDAKKKNEVVVVPLIWPCDSDVGIVKDYYDDQIAADGSAIAFARVFGKFLGWREQNLAAEEPCLKRVNVLAHSMGNRVLRGALAAAQKYYLPSGLPLVFRNTFLVAADVVNECLEPGKEGAAIAQTSRNVIVYHAADDLALRSSKVANLVNSVASRRLGHTGPEDMAKVPKNVFAVDCDEVNTKYDFPKGHSYFLDNGERGAKRRPGKVFQHIWETILTGRPPELVDASVRSLRL
jgi:esterase/lipase superfamily enzyme